MTIVQIEEREWSLEKAKERVADGWAGLVEACWVTCEQDEGEVYILDVTKKQGALRFYICGGTDVIALLDIIYEYEKDSEITCECCGMPGRLRQNKEEEVLCEACYRRRSGHE